MRYFNAIANKITSRCKTIQIASPLTEARFSPEQKKIKILLNQISLMDLPQNKLDEIHRKIDFLPIDKVIDELNLVTKRNLYEAGKEFRELRHQIHSATSYISNYGSDAQRIQIDNVYMDKKKRYKAEIKRERERSGKISPEKKEEIWIAIYRPVVRQIENMKELAKRWNKRQKINESLKEATVKAEKLQDEIQKIRSWLDRIDTNDTVYNSYKKKLENLDGHYDKFMEKAHRTRTIKIIQDLSKERERRFNIKAKQLNFNEKSLDKLQNIEYNLYTYFNKRNAKDVYEKITKKHWDISDKITDKIDEKWSEAKLKFFRQVEKVWKKRLKDLGVKTLKYLGRGFKLKESMLESISYSIDLILESILEESNIFLDITEGKIIDRDKTEAKGNRKKVEYHQALIRDYQYDRDYELKDLAKEYKKKVSESKEKPNYGQWLINLKIRRGELEDTPEAIAKFKKENNINLEESLEEKREAPDYVQGKVRKDYNSYIKKRTDIINRVKAKISKIKKIIANIDDDDIKDTLLDKIEDLRNDRTYELKLLARKNVDTLKMVKSLRKEEKSGKAQKIRDKIAKAKTPEERERLKKIHNYDYEKIKKKRFKKDMSELSTVLKGKKEWETVKKKLSSFENKKKQLIAKKKNAKDGAEKDRIAKEIKEVDSYIAAAKEEKEEVKVYLRTKYKTRKSFRNPRTGMTIQGKDTKRSQIRKRMGLEDSVI